MQTLQHTNRVLWLVILIPVIFFFGKPILVPVCFGMLFAMLMTPLCRRFDKRMGRGLSSMICTIIVLLSLGLIMSVIVWQLASFVGEMPVIKTKLGNLLTTLQDMIQRSFPVDKEKLHRFVTHQRQVVTSSTGHYLGDLIGSVSSAVVTLLLSLIFTFLFLFNKERYETFFVKLYKEEEPAHVRSVVKKISLVAEQYLLGRVYTILILFVLYTAGLLIIGVQNAFLLAAVAALLTIIPYIGNILSSIFPVVMALVTEDSYNPSLWTAGFMIFIHMIDNYFIEPYIVGSKVNLSSLATIVIIVCGGLLWGIPGTILFIPLLAIVKIICDHVENLHPYGYLLGDPDNKKPSRIRQWIMEKVMKRKR